MSVNHHLCGVDVPLTAHCDAVDVDWYRDDQPRFSDVARASVDRAVVQYHPGLDAFPLGASVLEPDLHLDLAETQLTSDD